MANKLNSFITSTVSSLYIIVDERKYNKEHGTIFSTASLLDDVISGKTNFFTKALYHLTTLKNLYTTFWESINRQTSQPTHYQTKGLAQVEIHVVPQL